MNYKKLMLAVTSAVFMLFILAGCTPKEGQMLIDALNKQTEINSYEQKTEVSLNIKPDLEYMSEEDMFGFDIINNALATVEVKEDLINGKQYINTTVDFGGIIFNMPVYYEGQTMWIKPPFERRYVEIKADDLAKLSKEINDSTINPITTEKQKELQKRVQVLINKFVTSYALEHSDAFKNLTYKGKQAIDTPEGSKEVSVIEIKFNDKEFKNFVMNTINDISNSKSFKEFSKSMVEFMPELIEMAGLENELGVDDFMNQLEDIRNNFDENYDMFLALLKEYTPQIEQGLKDHFEVGPNGLVLNFYIDQESYIVKTNAVMDMVFKEPNPDEDKNQEKVGFTLKLDSIMYNINKTVINKPFDTKTQTIPVKEYVKNSPIWKDSPLGEALGVNPVTTRIYLEEGNAYINYSPYDFSVTPYIKNGALMVPTDFAAKALRLDLKADIKGKKVTLSDDSKIMELSASSNFAYINKKSRKVPVKPEVNNGELMVPLRFVAEQFGGKISVDNNYYSWDDSYPTRTVITIEKK